MLGGIDHVVIACVDLAVAADELRDRVGLQAGAGGRHEALGTENVLVWLGESYLELLDVFDPARAAESWMGRPALAALERGGGLVAWALASDDIAADVSRLRAGGSSLRGPMPGERRRPDGEVVRWQLALPPSLGPDRVPFLIEHEADGAEWGPAAREARLQAVHPVGGRARLRRLEISVADPPALAARYRTDVGIGFEPPGSSILDAAVGPVSARQVIRLLPSGRDRPRVGVIVTISSGRPRSVDVFGCRFILEPEDD